MKIPENVCDTPSPFPKKKSWPKNNSLLSQKAVKSRLRLMYYKM